MITPKSLLSFLSEAADSEAAQQAKEMGLTSAGYGNWRDRTGNVVAKTVDGQLVMIDAKADPMARPEAPGEEMPPEEEEEPQFVEPDPDMVEKVAKGLSGGRYNIASAQRKKELLASARQILINKQIQDAQMQADADAQAAAQNPPEPTPEELEQQQADMELQQQNAVMDTELKAQSVENGKLDLQMKKDQMKQQKEAEKEAKAMDKLAKKAEAQKQAEADAQAQAEADAQAQAEVEAAQPTPEEMEQEKRDVEAKTAGDALIKALQSGDTKAEKKVVEKFRKRNAPKPEPKKEASVPGGEGTAFSDLRDSFSQLLESGELNNKKGEISNQQYAKLKERLENPTVAQMASEFMDEHRKLYSKENIRNFEKTGTFKDVDGAMSFMENTLGMVRNKKGRLVFGDLTPAQRIAMGDSPGEGVGFREFRGMDFYQQQALQDPKVRGILDNVIGGTAQPEITYNDRRNFQQGYLKNNISTEDARSIYDQLDPKIQRAIDNMGQPERAQGIFAPDAGSTLEYFQDGGKMSGDTDLDMMMNDPESREEFLSNFTTTRAPDQERGVMVLQRLLNTGFKDQATGLPLFGGLRAVTADHVVGRRQASNDPLDYPLNLAFVARNLNQFKSGNSAQYGDDSFNKLVNSDNTNIFERNFDPETAWYAKRLLDSHFESDRLEKMMGIEPADSGPEAVFPDTVQALETVDSKFVENLAKRGGATNPLGLNIANLTKAPPRPQGKGEQQLGKNTWRGTSGNGYGGTQQYLDGYRKSAIYNVMQSPDLNTEIDLLKQKMQGKPPAKIEEEIRKARTKYAEKYIKIPQQGISSIYGLGRISNKEYVDWFRNQGMKGLEGMKETNPDMYNKMVLDLNNGLDKWEKKLGSMVNGDRPYEFPQGDPKVLKSMNDEWGRQAMKSAEARKYLSEEEINRFYETIKNPEDWAEPMGEGLTNDSGSVILERLKRLRKPLNATEDRQS
ncbi:hypothetical protein Syn7803US30_184 [Synechococcus phage ACG-2014f]|uniref:Cytitidyltransferase n=2 Tax=Atlauavirus tusconc8 TaxID=2734085 RepID=A0A0E3HMK6_9CAUD|nr:hypothetical protein HOQ62_gp187 [Synechococcus phage ACG-2014f_Syn7803C8]AIX29580.1 hypothetical protein Syn7803US30_184 [Synechococcus phage ACG-2014f]AIX21511.1 hypothetical protein Syn7803C8_187 [Synechococcus phage ACG-2014f_Syn7803C8]AIX31530.1 hypothetical protein Syn7803US40_186 [Synechococcus phage ACG-2014f]AIX31816.1 hypothetical protein Syn7803US42_188 [Synechococcus phage ACG-2014f]AIX33171.1 hypothetical protein Syn7803US50_187 [Synechococcus phage ACG-2014f]